MKTNLNLAAIRRAFGVLFVSLCLAITARAAPNLSIDPSRTSGVAPLYVFFDATGTTSLAGGANALANADFSWDFDTTNVDPDGKWEQTRGMVAGHVFEAPGTYTVSCTVTAADGTTDTDTVTITVSAFGGTTYYVAANGSNANPGTQASPWLTAAHAIGQLDANERVLFRRGDTFPGGHIVVADRTGGPMIIGAYGAGALPVLNSPLTLSNSDDVRVMDIHFVISGGSGRALTSSSGSTHNLALRLEVEGTESNAIYQDLTDTFGVFDCYLHDIFILGLFSGDGTRFSWVGNTIDGLDGTPQPEHAMRIQRGEKQFIAHNLLQHLKETKTAMTIRGDGQRHVMIYQNVLDRIIAVNPTKSTDYQMITDVVVEGNYVGQNAENITDGWGPDLVGIGIQATRVVVRNNVVDAYRRAINVSGINNSGLTVGIVDIYNNTANWRPYSPTSGTSGTLAVIQRAYDVNVRNNFISAPTLGQATVSAVSTDSTNVTVSNNLATATPGYVVNPLPDSAAHNNSPFNYALLVTSPAVNAGANNVPVFSDLEGFPRPSGAVKDVGAFEFDEGDSTPTITTTTLPSATAGSAYSFTLAAAGGNGALTWSLASGSLPAGISLSSGGVISGTPSASGSANVTVQVSDADSDTDTQALSLVVTQQGALVGFDMNNFAGSTTLPAPDYVLPTTAVTGSFTDANLETLALSVGPAFVPGDQVGFYRFGGTNVPTTAVVSGNYMEFTVAPRPGYQFTLSPTNSVQIYSRTYDGGDGSAGVFIRSSLDNFTTTLAQVSGGTDTMVRTFNLAGFTNVTSAVTFRVYLFDTHGTADWSVRNNGTLGALGNLEFVINGTVAEDN